MTTLRRSERLKRQRTSATTADNDASTPLDQALPIELLSQIGQYLHPFELVAASSISRAVQQAFASDLAWTGSSLELHRDFFPFIESKYSPNSIRKLNHLTVQEHWQGGAELFMSRLPHMEHLLSVTGLFTLTPEFLQRFPSLHTVDLEANLTEPLLTALTQLPHLTSLTTGEISRFDVNTLIAALPRFNSNVKISMQLGETIARLSTDELRRLLPATHYLNDMFLMLSVETITDILTEQPDAFSNPPADSRVRSMFLWLYLSDREEDDDDFDNDVIDQLMSIPAAAIRVLGYYPLATELTVLNSTLRHLDAPQLQQYCHQRGVTLIGKY